MGRWGGGGRDGGRGGSPPPSPPGAAVAIVAASASAANAAANAILLSPCAEPHVLILMLVLSFCLYLLSFSGSWASWGLSRGVGSAWTLLVRVCSVSDGRNGLVTRPCHTLDPYIIPCLRRKNKAHMTRITMNGYLGDLLQPKSAYLPNSATRRNIPLFTLFEC